MDPVTLLIEMDKACPVKCDVWLSLGAGRSLELNWNFKIRKPHPKVLRYRHCFSLKALDDIDYVVFKLKTIRETMKEGLKI